MGWHAMTSRPAELVTTALRMALWHRDHEGHAIGEGLLHHSDTRSQYTSIRLTDDLFIEGIADIEYATMGWVDWYNNR